MDSMNIPDEAVEAVAKVFYEDGWTGPPFWESLDADDPSRLEYLATTRTALEAAAPHLLAEAWDEGLDAGLNGGWNNPYRSQG